MSLFNIICSLWILSEIILNRIARSGKKDKKSADKNTELFLWITITLSITIGIYFSYLYPLNIYKHKLLYWLSLFLLVCGVIIRLMAIQQLGKFFTVDVTIRENHQLKQNGFYRFVRHPSYTGALLSFAGLGFAINNWFSLAIIFIPILYVFIIRMNTEEQVLIEQFGKEYLAYKSKTKRLIPFIY